MKDTYPIAMLQVRPAATILSAAWQEYANQDVPYGTVVTVEFRNHAVSDAVSD
jgi:hypothetical protein